VDLGAVWIKKHDGIGEALLLMVFDPSAAEGAKGCDNKKRPEGQPGRG
tara:strand:+ start:658 stop:801 length:144 start_codon:yes stop_codon:yes gene_type:complete